MATVIGMPGIEIDALVITATRVVMGFGVIIHSAKLELYTTVGERVWIDMVRDHDSDVAELSITCDDENGGLHTILKCGVAPELSYFDTEQLIRGAIEARYSRAA